MKTVYLLRHDKSSWKNPGLDDHERPLNRRGRQVAKRMEEYLWRAKVAPDVVLCSTAVRAKQTLDPIAKRIRPPKVVFERAKAVAMSVGSAGERRQRPADRP
jgi:phosphohistidine phosphatase